MNWSFKNKEKALGFISPFLLGTHGVGTIHRSGLYLA